MNISTGGPHILFFERDQQLAMLLTSEFQLAGYECHTARTAVEVFDAIARHPVRLVLVNLAQAAASRREFWVALDTQRRGRGVQVFTFHCFNLAGYGARDPDESSQTMLADMEIDGMTGIMGLVDAVRNRIPSANSTGNTMPRTPRVQAPSQSYTAPAPASAPSYNASNASYSAPNTGGNYRPAPPAQEALSTARASQGAALQAQGPAGMQSSSFAAPPTQISPMQPMQPPAQGSQGPQTYSDKIRAVLYPNQRSWSTPNGAVVSTLQEGTRTVGDVQSVQPVQSTQTSTMQGGPYYQVQSQSQPASPPANDISVLQRLANGQTGESGLAQLSRMVQERYPGTQDAGERTYVAPAASAPPPREALRPAPAEQATYATATNGYSQASTPPAAQVAQASPVPQTPPVQPAPPVQQMTQAPAMPIERPAASSESASTPSLRASPIQDMPSERAVGNQVMAEGTRRIDASARQTQSTPLASISTPMPAAPVVPQTPPVQASPAAQTSVQDEDEAREPTGPLAPRAKPPVDMRDIAALLEQRQHSHGLRLELDEPVSPGNAMLLDIVQSLPPMPPPSQPLQVQALNGRATRSLGSVLLEGHLVPENRLDVAQNIQRMLRGVDLNYQLGEILLMFKLLTPDQLLAASLVSYGMITTTQISGLGRIRQELHAIGLEYDLENLLIMFRILSSEQLREVRSSWQG